MGCNHSANWNQTLSRRSLDSAPAPQHSSGDTTRNERTRVSTTTVHKVSTKSQDGEAVQWEGTKEQSLLLQENGWILGAAFGDSKDLSGSAILRGHVGIPGSSYALAYPGDYIVRINDVLSVVPEDVFTENFDVGGEETLENDFVEEVLPEYASHPTGEQARPPEQMPMGTVEPGPETLD